MLRAFVKEGKGTIPMNSGTPFYTTSNNPQTCQNMQDQDTCEQTWQVNATGEINTTWKFFTIYDSITYGPIELNKTDKVNITIVAPSGEFISITLHGYPIDFSNKDPNTIDNPGVGNYTISIDPETTINVDLYQKGNDYINDSYILGIGNMTWKKIDDAATSASVTKTYSSVEADVAKNTEVPMYYWIDLPTGQHAGDYTSTIFIKAVETGTLP
ncbi:MAG: hypothetical protein IIB81_01885 [Nanoarchaeota archaeon]|nr:hypothetical protein [Nanoarchaeota archaeon]